MTATTALDTTNGGLQHSDASLPPATRDWRRVSTTFYRRVALVTPGWHAALPAASVAASATNRASVGLAAFNVVCDANAGTVAVAPAHTRTATASSASSAAAAIAAATTVLYASSSTPIPHGPAPNTALAFNAVALFSSAGTLLSSFPWLVSHPTLALSWIPDGRLCAVFADSSIRLFDLRGHQTIVELDRPLLNGLHSARISGSTVVLLTLNFDLIVVDDVTEISTFPTTTTIAPSSTATNTNPPTAVRTSDCPSTSLVNEPHCWTVHATTESITGGSSSSTATAAAVDSVQQSSSSSSLPGSLSQSGMMSPQTSTFAAVEIVLAFDGGVLIVDELQARQCSIPGVHEAILDIVFSPNTRLAALYTDTNRIIVTTSDFTRVLSDFQTNNQQRPDQFAWCGSDSVVALWGTRLVIVGPMGHYATYTVADGTVLFTECDGVRLLSLDGHSFVQRVPRAFEAVFAIGSMEPGALLFDAYSMYIKGDPVCDERIRDLHTKAELATAITDCIDAACEAIYPPRQRLLLRAASFGQCFLDITQTTNFDREKLSEASRCIRVLNSLSQQGVGMPLTYQQFLKTSPMAIVNRLIQYEQFVLAFRICDFLRVPKGAALSEWACMKIRAVSERIFRNHKLQVKSVVNDEIHRLKRLLLDRLLNPVELPAEYDVSNMNVLDVENNMDTERSARYRQLMLPLVGISFARIASVARDYGFDDVAVSMIRHETSLAKQVELLLEMGCDELATSVACASGDSDLVHLLLTYLSGKHSPAEFFRLVDREPLLVKMLQAGSEHPEGRKTLRSYYYQKDEKIEHANCLLVDALEEPSFSERQAQIKRVSRMYGTSKATAFESKSMDELYRFNQYRQSLLKSLPNATHLFTMQQAGVGTGSSLPGNSRIIPCSRMSIAQTISALLDEGELSLAQRLKSDSKMDDRKFFLLRLSSLQRAKDDEGADKLIKENSKIALQCRDAIEDALLESALGSAV